ncbi:hypothetical protein BDQ17DRAFT_1253792, partial [Cyathus striatus]
GAGIGGLTLAVALTRLLNDSNNSQAINVDIYELKDKISEIGTGIVMYRRAWNIMQRVGVDQDLQKHLQQRQDDTIRMLFSCIRSTKNNSLALQDVGGMPCFHRSSVQQALLKDVSPEFKFHLNRRFISYKETADCIVLNFADGISAECDLLVGADGLRSKVRKAYLDKFYSEKSESINPTWCGSVTYRSIVEAKVLEEKFPHHEALTHPIKHIVVYPIGRGHLNVSVVVSNHEKDGTLFDEPSVQDVRKRDILTQFEGWATEAQAILELIPDTCRKWPIQYLKSLQDFGRGKVVILGDAAHAMTPNQGAGAGQAMEDAYILASLIEKSIRQRIPLTRVTEVFSTVRPPVAKAVMEGSAKSGRLTEQDHHGVDISNPDALQKFRNDFSETFAEHYSWYSSYPLETLIEKSLEML